MSILGIMSTSRLMPPSGVTSASWLMFVVVASFLVCSTSANSYKQPTITVVLLARNKEHMLPYFLTLFDQLDYPKQRMALYIRADHCEDRTIDILEDWLAKSQSLYHFVDVHLDRNSSRYPGEMRHTDRGDAAYESIIAIKERALLTARRMWTDYVLFLDMDVLITEADVISLLLAENKPIISPMINSLGKYTNFWGGMTDQYWYERTDQYMDIIENKINGCFNVPMIHSFVLVNLKIAETDYLTFNPDKLPGYELPLDDIITFAISAQHYGLEMHVCNDRTYGFMTPPVTEGERADTDRKRLTSIKLEVNIDMEPLSVHSYLQHYIPPLPKKDKLGFDQIYIINLPRRQDRLKRMEHSFDELGLDVLHIDAVDGKELDDAQLHRLNIQLLPGYKDPYGGRHITYGEIGCFLSHYNVWKDVVKNGYDKILLFEDDIRFEPFFKEHVSSLLEHLEKDHPDWDLVYLGRKKLKGSEEDWVSGSDRLVHVEYSYWTLCYLLTGRGAAKLLAADPLSHLLPVDEFLPLMFDKHPESGWSEAFPLRDLTAYSVAPLLVFPTHYTGEEGYISDTEASDVLPLAGTGGDTVEGAVGTLDWDGETVENAEDTVTRAAQRKGDAEQIPTRQWGYSQQKGSANEVGMGGEVDMENLMSNMTVRGDKYEHIVDDDTKRRDYNDDEMPGRAGRKNIKIGGPVGPSGVPSAKDPSDVREELSLGSQFVKEEL